MISLKDLCKLRVIKLLFFTFLLIALENKVAAQCPAPAQPFFSYDGGDITFSTSDSIGKCYKNLQAGQTYCFYMVQPLDTIVEIDMNMNGCNICPISMYAKVDTYSAYVRVVGSAFGNASIDKCITFNPFQDSLRCNFRTYNPSCNLMTKGIIEGNCSGLNAGAIYTYCFTVPPACGGMSFCPLYKCGTCPSLKVDSGTICVGDCFRISATLAGGKPPYTYSWTPNIGNGPGPYSVCPATSTTYRLQVTDSAGLVFSDSGRVTVRPKPNLVLSPDTSICRGASVLLNAAGGTNYLWIDSAGLSCGSCNNPTANPVNSTTYTVIASNGFCADTNTMSVAIYPSPVVSAGPDIQICPGWIDTLNACCGVTYLWNPSTGLSDSSISNPLVSVLANTSYTIQITDSNGCAASDTVLVSIYPSFTANAGPDIQLCFGETDTLNACCGNAYAWSPSGSLSNPAISNPILNTTVNGTYTVTITDNNGCQKSDSLNVTVYPALNVTSGPDLKICAGNGDTISVCCGQSYLWSPAAGLSNPNINNPIANPSATTTYTVTVTDANGCSASADVNVSVLSLPVASINPLNATICIGDNILLTASGGNSYLWSTGATNSSISVSPVSNAGFSVTVTDANLCSASANASVVVDQLPSADAGPDVTITRGGSVILNASGGIRYQWIPTADLSCEFCINPTASPNNDREYCVIVSNTNNCSDTDCVLVTVIPDVNVFIPNVFTPNQDGNNDYFQLYGNLQYINQCEVTVWNRWGEKVFASNDLLFKWDGIYIGKKVPPGVYAYQISLNLVNETTAKKYKGSVTVLE